MRSLFFTFLMAFSLSFYGSEKTNFVLDDFEATLSPTDKAAILMVHFGTTYEKTRKESIEIINNKVKRAFPRFEVREAYTSRIVMRRLKKKGVFKDTPIDALLKLRADGYAHILVQSTNCIEGIEMEALRREVATVASFFKDIRVGTPLLYQATDAQKVAAVLAKRYENRGEVVLVGHGTYTPATATYAMMDYIFNVEGYTHFHVSTIEGYPTFDTLLTQLKKTKAKHLTLLPFMLVVGNHAHNDIAGDWRAALEKEGYEVDVVLEGLGQVPEIQDLFIEHLHFIMKHRMIDIIQKKARYAKETDE